MNCLQKFSWEVLYNLRYIPPVAPRDYHLFRSFEKSLAGRQIKPDFEDTEATGAQFEAKGIKMLQDGISKLMWRRGNYVEKWFSVG
jgi:hypothetical protein